MKPITVIGGANVDLCGSAAGPVIPKDSNPGRVRMTAGGVGRNIAESLARLGLPVRLLCALGRDEQGAFLDRQCRQAGAFRDRFHDRLAPETLALLEDFARLPEAGFLERRRILCRHRIFKSGCLRNFGMFLIV